MINLLDNDAFTLAGLTAAVNNLPFKPGKLSAMGLFDEQGITTTSVTIEVQDDVLNLVPVVPRGASGAVNGKASRAVHSFAVPHIPQTDTVLADSIQNVRAFGSEDQLQSVMQVINQRMATMRNANEYTIESHRVAAVQGKYMDAAGNLQSIYTLFGVTETTVPVGLTVETTDIIVKCSAIIDAVEEGLGGLSYDHVHVMCSKDFFDALIAHPKVKELYLNSVSNQSIRGEMRTTFEFGGIVWERYNGTTDVKIAAGEARAFPVGVMDLFISRFAPANYAETVNTLGLPMYAKMEEMRMGKGYELEVQSNPLNLCTRPKALIKLKKTAS